MNARELLKTRETVLLDGAMGTMLQAAGLPLGAKPEALNLENPALIESIHAQYAAAGSRIVCAAAGIGCARRAVEPYGGLVALDVGPLGELLEPAGTLPFEEAVSAFAEIIRAGAEAGADLVLCETFTDLYELKAALLACKENCGLPVLASMSFEAGGRTFTGCTVESFAATARAGPLPAAPSRALPPRRGASGPTRWGSTAVWGPKRSTRWQRPSVRRCRGTIPSLSSPTPACPGPTAAATTSPRSCSPCR